MDLYIFVKSIFLFVISRNAKLSRIHERYLILTSYLSSVKYHTNSHFIARYVHPCSVMEAIFILA